jgi:DNA-binding response OmpR family regulator
VPKVMIVEDDRKIVESVQKAFTLEEGFSLFAVLNADRAVAEAAAKKPDLILLDIRLQNEDGRQVLKALKASPGTAAIPVIFLSGLSSEGDRVLGLKLGADDYVVKPFGALELLARIQAVLRRAGAPQAGPLPKRIEAAGLKIDGEKHSATYHGKPIRLQPKEFEILSLLAAHPGRALSRPFLIENSSSFGLEVSTRSLDTHIKNIRKKLGAGSKLIETVPKLGYKFVEIA